MNTRRLAVGLLVGATVIVGCKDPSTPVRPTGVPSGPRAIVAGQIDPGHPYVGALIFDVPSPSWFPVAYQPWYCSGTLLSRRVIQTAAHCFTLAAQDGGYPAFDLPVSRVHVSFAQNVTDPSSWRSVSGYAFHPDYVTSWAGDPFGVLPDVALVFLSQPVNDIEPGRLAPAGYLESFATVKNPELKAVPFWEVGYGMLGADDNFALTGDRRLATASFQGLDANFLTLRDPGGGCYGDSGGPILVQSDGVEYVVHIRSSSDQARRPREAGLHGRF